MDVDRIIGNNTKIRYGLQDGISLPETYNGLGSRNLIYILLKLLEFFKDHTSREYEPGIHLIFIEEPEAHLHPQMQEVFVRKLNEIADIFSKKFNHEKKWPVQFVISTHSPHMANEADFTTIRYFLHSSKKPQKTKIKDLSNGLTGKSWEKSKDFLHKYMTLTRCDLFFADKAMLIEGPSERLMMPRMKEKIEVQEDEELLFTQQYISTIEVGGAYAHLFFDLLKFLEIPTLIITDLDSVQESHSEKGKLTHTKCKVSAGIRSSNACINSFFKKTEAEETTYLKPNELIEKEESEKTSGILRLAYQVPEEGSNTCGRSFEEAFILANPELFDLDGLEDDEKENSAWEQAKEISKTDFALKYGIEDNNWKVPKYIAEGLIWLAKEQNSSINKQESE